MNNNETLKTNQPVTGSGYSNSYSPYMYENTSPLVWPQETTINSQLYMQIINSQPSPSNSNSLRTFESGANRDLDNDKNDYVGCFCPLVLEEYGKYMLEHSYQPDGTSRPSDNWKKGIPRSEYFKSLLRHVWDVWKLHLGYDVFDKRTGHPVLLKTALCAVMFNIMGYFHEFLKEQNDIRKS